ncbi:MAG: FHA domain-containing protein [Micropruina sp.]
MSELVVLALKILFLALLWLFVLFTGNVIRTDMFGRKVTTDELGEIAPARKRRQDKRLPTRLKISKGTQVGLTLPLEGGIKIGRSSDCQLILDDDYVSTRHAQIARGGDGYVIEDLGSTNGTYLNGERITVPTPFTLTDTVRIGRTLMIVER